MGFLLDMIHNLDLLGIRSCSYIESRGNIDSEGFRVDDEVKDALLWGHK